MELGGGSKIRELRGEEPPHVAGDIPYMGHPIYLYTFWGPDQLKSMSAESDLGVLVDTQVEKWFCKEPLTWVLVLALVISMHLLSGR